MHDPNSSALRAAALQHLPQAVVALAADFAVGHRIAAHRHPRAQLAHAVRGLMRVGTVDGTWMVPPGLALWLPADVAHTIEALTPLAMRTLYVTPDAAPWLPVACRVVSVPRLLHELILEAVALPQEQQLSDADSRLMAVVLDRLQGSMTSPLTRTRSGAAPPRRSRQRAGAPGPRCRSGLAARKSARGS